MGSEKAYRFSLRLTEEENNKLETIIKHFNKRHNTKISKNDMLIKLIGDKYNDSKES